MSEPTNEPILLMYAPYLPLRERIDVNGWVLVPVAELDQAERVSDFAATAAAGLARLYSRSDQSLTGAFAYRSDDGLGGGDFDGADVLKMRRALVVMALDGTPSPLRDEDERDWNEAHRMVTSDNAMVYGHRIAPDGYVAAEYGAIVRTLSGGYNVLVDHLEPPLRIRPPADLWMPSFRASFDGELADAVHRVISADGDEARRLDRAIGWLDLAWRNAESITLDLRVPALRSGFETLFDVDGTRDLRLAMSALLDPKEAPRTHRVWKDRDRELQDSLTELEWWFVCFTLLRNAIAHGDELDDARYLFGEHSHLDIAGYRLREAIKATVIASGFPELELSPGERILRRAMRKYGLAPPDAGSDDEP